MSCLAGSLLCSWALVRFTMIRNKVSLLAWALHLSMLSPRAKGISYSVIYFNSDLNKQHIIQISIASEHIKPKG